MPTAFSNTHSDPRSAVPRVAIVGTGFVGSTSAYALLMSGTVAEIVLIDRHRKRAEGHANDLRDAALFSHNAKVVVGDFGDCHDADVTIIAAGVSPSLTATSRLDDLQESTSILKHVLGGVVCQSPRILLIASNPVDVTHAARKWSGLPARRVIGSERVWIPHAFEDGSPNSAAWRRKTCTLISSASTATAR
jgi:L-lactate dehydrogenase